MRNWQNLMISRGWIVKDKDKVKYCLCRKGETPREITEEEYKRAWHKYFALTANGMGRKDALLTIFYKWDGMPRKQVGFIENAFFLAKFAELQNILEDSSLL